MIEHENPTHPREPMKSRKLQTSKDATHFTENANALVKLFEMFITAN